MKLSDPISNWMPELKDLKAERRREGQAAEEVALDRPVTVQDLLRHTSGFVYARARRPSASRALTRRTTSKPAPAPSPATRC
jgi:CubicO group peptidase (beta-lactamase class C family)